MENVSKKVEKKQRVLINHPSVRISDHPNDKIKRRKENDEEARQGQEEEEEEKEG